MFDREALSLAGCCLLRRPIGTDARGTFRKIVHGEAFAAMGLSCDFVEQYVSTSAPGVLRGMHFQTPPHDHAKLVTVLSGRILDVIVDLRPGPDYGRHASVELDGSEGVSLWLPSGIAHGFLALEAATVLYDVTSVHAPANDAGIRFDSFGFAWPIAAPILSERDRALPPLSDFVTTFPPAAGRTPPEDRP